MIKLRIKTAAVDKVGKCHKCLTNQLVLVDATLKYPYQADKEPTNCVKGKYCCQCLRQHSFGYSLLGDAPVIRDIKIKAVVYMPDHGTDQLTHISNSTYAKLHSRRIEGVRAREYSVD